MSGDDEVRRAHDIRASLINLRGFCGELEHVIAAVSDGGALEPAARMATDPDASPSHPPTGAHAELDDARLCVSSIRSLIDRLERQIGEGGVDAWR